jgi:hypothetical protein
VSAAVRICERLEGESGLPAGTLRFELQIEVPQAVISPDGVATVARLIQAADGRCEGLHYGTYDFSAAAGVVAGQQSLEHPLADHAKAVMQLAAAQTGIRVSDGSTNVIPSGSAEAVRSAWALHARLVQRSLRRAIYQGWDMHPGHLVTRYAATYDFYRSEFGPSCARLARYVARASSGFLDEPATAVALAGVLLRAVDCGACDDAEVAEATGPPPEEATLREAMEHKLRTEAGRSIYKMRKAIVEPVFGQIKERRGFRRFSFRGLRSVGLEWELICLTGNLLKLFRFGRAPQVA